MSQGWVYQITYLVGYVPNKMMFLVSEALHGFDTSVSEIVQKLLISNRDLSGVSPWQYPSFVRRGFKCRDNHFTRGNKSVHGVQKLYIADISSEC